ncbi:MAG: bifunctional hydroxymethylpyrimidine kinase/phosphomethylpyrimidine kinase [Candidatus Bathyarchaeota archaeon]|nr:bifunctional hydroxymethylpyrimidine kinase/phosphomethylpyrimidine kinase [Candidatus Bathyarchaeota archaeon]
MKSRIPVAITIAGSDSGGGAGIQADLKTFAALGVHGTVAVTSVTAQNTYSVKAVQDLKQEIVCEQIRAVAEDFGIDAGKTGMLHTDEIVKATASEVSKYNFPLVVDPVMVAKSGAPLLKPEAVKALKEHLLPLATVVTPNKFEAERLSGLEIKSLRDAETAAKEISKMGPEAVVVKGGHISGVDVTDILYYEGRFWQFTSPRLDAKTTHGTGCSFSAAIAAELAKKLGVPEAVKKAKNFVALSIKFGLNIGKGPGPVNPMAYLYREASRYEVLLILEEAKNLLEGRPEVAELIPEVGMNIAMAVRYAENVDDVAAVDGRIIKTLSGARAVGNPKFGCSRHLAKYLVEIVKHNEDKRAAINLKFSEEILKILEKRGLTISFYDRAKEPEEIKRVEGMSISWGVKEAIKSVGKVPDVIYHRGDLGKEPMIIVFGKDAVSLAKLVVEIAVEKKGNL